MKKSPAFAKFGKAIGKFFHRYHIIIFVLTVVIGVLVGVLLLNNLITLSGQLEPVSSSGTTFDEVTIKRIENLVTIHDDSSSELTLPPGRISPFVE